MSAERLFTARRVGNLVVRNITAEQVTDLEIEKPGSWKKLRALAERLVSDDPNSPVTHLLLKDLFGPQWYRDAPRRIGQPFYLADAYHYLPKAA